MAGSLRLHLTSKRALANLDGASGQEYLERVQNILAREMSSGQACIQVGVDTDTEVAATLAITCDNATATAGDKLLFILPDGVVVYITASASPSEVAGTYSFATSDAVMATSVAKAINAYPPLNRYFSAVAASDVVTVTAKDVGTAGNSIKCVKQVTNAGTFTIANSGAFSGGLDASDRPSGTFTCTQASIVDASTTIVGSVTFTWKTSGASGENQVNIGATDTEAATNLAAAINAHSKLKQIVLATSAVGVVTCKYWCGGREGELVRMTGTTGVVASVTALTSSVAGAYLANARQFSFGMPTG